MKLSEYMYLSIALGVVVVGMLGTTGALFDQYDIDDSGLQSINRSIELGDRIEATYEKFQSEDIEEQWIGSQLIYGASIVWDTLITFITIPDLFGDFISDIGGEAKIPPLILGAIIMAIITSVIIAFLIILSNKEW